MSTDAAAKIPSHQPSKRSRAPPPPPTKKLSFEGEDKNGSASEQEKEALKNNGNLDEASEVEERQLTVVLPGDKLVKASVKKDTPILELLIMIASKNHLNPTGHMIAQPAPRPRDAPIMLKPNQRLSDVAGDTIYIMPRNQKQIFVHKKEDKKSAVYEPSTRITVISSKNHKMCLRVDPDKTLQDLLPAICDEREVDPSKHTLRLVDQPQEPLDMSQTLEKTGVIEFLLVDLNGQPAGGEVDLMPEQKKKKGLFGRISKKKKGYEFGGGGTSPPDTAVTSTLETEQRGRRHTSPSSFPAHDPTSIQEQDDPNSNTLRKRRPAPLPPQGKQNVAGSGGASEDDEKSEDDPSSVANFNSLRKRRAPAPPRPTSPPRRSMSLGANSPPVVQDLHVPPPRPLSPPHKSGEDGKLHEKDVQAFSPIPEESPPSIHTGSFSSMTETGIDESFQEAIAMGISSETKEKKDKTTAMPNGDTDRANEETVRLMVEETSINTKGEDKQEAEPTTLGEGTPKAEMDKGKETDDSLQPEEKEKERKAKKELLSHMMTMSLDDDTKDTENYPPHTQADDSNILLEEKSVHALAFEVTREDASGDSQEIADETLKENEKDVEKQEVVALKENPKRVEERSPVTESREDLKESEDSPKNGEKGASPSSGEVSVEKLNEQYIALQGQLAALQKQMTMPQQADIMEMQLQQLQQQIVLQQQLISQMMMSSNQQPMVMPLAYQQAMMTPQQQMMLAQQQIMSPPQQMMPTAMVSPQQQMIPPQMVSPQQQMLQHHHMVPPPQQTLISPQQIVLPQQQMVSPQQMALTAQQLLVSLPMLSPAIPQSTIPTGNSPESATATVQAQQTPIPSTLEVNKSTESPVKDEAVPNEDDEVPAKEAVATEVQTELQQRPLSPPLKADEVTVGHPTYHFARSHDMPKRKSLVITASPPSTLRSSEEHQRPALYKAELGSPESKSEEGVLSKKTEITEPRHDTDKSQSVMDAHEASPVADKPADQNQIQTNGGEDVKKATTETSDHPTSATTESSSVSAFAVSEPQPSNESASSKEPKSPKQKKSGFSLFKKKTPKYSYILSAQKEFSRKSETERQHSNSAKPADAKAKSDKGTRDLWSR